MTTVRSLTLVHVTPLSLRRCLSGPPGAISAGGGLLGLFENGDPSAAITNER